MKTTETKKWEEIFMDKDMEPKAGFYLPKDLGTRHGLMLVSSETVEKFSEKVYELDVTVAVRQPPSVLRVHLVTDSVELLKTLANRAFPLNDFAALLTGIESETVFDSGQIGVSGEPDISSSSIRVIPVGKDTYELRMIKR